MSSTWTASPTDNNTTAGNIDRAGDSYSADALGTTVTWGGATFNIGAATTNNVVQMGGVPISLPQGNYTSIKLLGTGTYGVKTGTFIVHYTDGTTASFIQAFSDWRGGYTGGDHGAGRVDRRDDDLLQRGQRSG